MIVKRLEMIFTNAAGRRGTLSVLDPRSDHENADLASK